MTSRVRGESFLHSRAANGAANRPPKTSPATIFQVSGWPARRMKEVALAMVRKNSAKFTEPMVVRGSLPEPIRLLVTTGPQPPPPAASTKPPKSASLATWRGARRLITWR